MSTILWYSIGHRIEVEHDDVIKWKYFPRYWPFVQRIRRSPVNSPHKGQSRGAFMLSLICAWINGWVNNGETGDLRRYRAHYDVIVMTCVKFDYYLKQPIPICKQKNTQIIFAINGNCCNHLWASLLQYFGDCFMKPNVIILLSPIHQCYQRCSYCNIWQLLYKS